MSYNFILYQIMNLDVLMLFLFNVKQFQDLPTPSFEERRSNVITIHILLWK